MKRLATSQGWIARDPAFGWIPSNYLASLGIRPGSEVMVFSAKVRIGAKALLRAPW